MFKVIEIVYWNDVWELLFIHRLFNLSVGLIFSLTKPSFKQSRMFLQEYGWAILKSCSVYKISYVYQLSSFIMSTIVPDLPWKIIEINSCSDDWIIAMLIIQNYSGFMIFLYWKYLILGLKLFKIHFIQTKNTLTVKLFFTLHFTFTLPTHFTSPEFYFIYRPTNRH